ncbi:hypothetical protein KIN20_028748 [Parelaphostrongylus tenuis]|uniref:Exonuclease domain-containing protein n=1 Tax=Parelaphostrongylus tenuis TaxID=148309 RepID=A0AAD5WFB2_PARTN|nr:hypothetical protein KIN20_028748 [Parelaphostrongylus tenuis]
MSQMVGKIGRLVWNDCKMTDLDHEKQTLVEIAVILTDKDLNIIAEGPDIVINQPEEVLDNMEDWSRKTFAENGLLSKIRESKIDMKQAEDMDSFMCRLENSFVGMLSYLHERDSTPSTWFGERKPP